MKPSAILIYYHCGSNTGYAIGRHEPDFYKMAKMLTGNPDNIHIGFPSLDGGMPNYVDSSFRNIIKLDPYDSSPKTLKNIYSYIRDNKINVAFGYDQPVKSPVYSAMRKGGVKLLISYWGAPMSSINYGIKLLLKKIEVKLRWDKPDHYIFQSNAMADSAVSGRGIDPRHVCVIRNAVDTEIYKPEPSLQKYAHNVFNIPEDRKIVVYSGHMEERKGVRVIVDAANELTGVRNRKDLHFLFLGNKNGEEKAFESKYKATASEHHITFGGYRNDIREILPSCYIGVIASTGWDSFPMSSMEMASTELPLIVSNLQGLVETVEDGKTGYLFSPGDHIALADKIQLLLENQNLQKKMGTAGRARVIEKFSHEKHIENLVLTIQELCNIYL